MRFKLISCEIFHREMCAATARSPHVVDLEFLPKGLHDIGSAKMLRQIQESVDRSGNTPHDAILLGYALCNNGIAGLTARATPLVVPKAHDCITLFLGSSARYLDYFHSHPGVYFETSGWIERGEAGGELRQLSIGHGCGMDMTWEELVAKYGEDNARFLQSELCDITRNYSQFTYIDMGIEPSEVFEAKVKKDAAGRGWKYERIQGDMSMIQRLVDGVWDEKEFLVVPPAHRVAPTYGDDILKAVGP